MAVRREIKIVISDLHLGAGSRPGMVNPYEDFHQDDRLAEFIRHYSEGEYAAMPVELVINGDFLDLLKVPYRGRFVTDVTEDVAVEKVRRCLLGHPRVFDAMADFLHTPAHRVTYIAGNHDLDIAFPQVQRMMNARLGVEPDSKRLVFLTEEEFYRMPGGVVVTHGHMLEEINRTEAGKPLVVNDQGQQVVNMPWGSLFYANVLAPVKAEMPIIDVVQPLSSFLLWGLVFDLRFTLRLVLNMVRFFVRTRMKAAYEKHVDIVRTIQMFAEELALYNNIERRASRLLRNADDIAALIVGHSHKATVRRYPRNKIYVNTGTWIQRVSLDLRNLGTSHRLTYAEVEYGDRGPPAVRLMRWRGVMRKCEEMVQYEG